MKKILYSLIVVLALATVGVAQNQKFKVLVTGQAAEISQLNFTEYQPAIGAEAMGTVGKVGNLRFSAGINFLNNFETETRTYHLAGQASYHVGVFEPFARFSAGIDHDTVISKKTFSRNILLGADINAGRFSFRPIAIGFKRQGEFLAPAQRFIQTGVGFNFN